MLHLNSLPTHSAVLPPSLVSLKVSNYSNDKIHKFVVMVKLLVIFGHICNLIPD